jgi:hypothetical protein
MEYIVIEWPESQYLMNTYGYEHHSSLINDEEGINKHGSSAYFVEKHWWDEVCRCKSGIL